MKIEKKNFVLFSVVVILLLFSIYMLLLALKAYELGHIWRSFGLVFIVVTGAVSTARAYFSDKELRKGG
jgi:multidrug transporter EmrE-like cation transporter